MSSFGTSLSEAFGVVETLENQDKNSGVQKLEHEQKHMNKVCSKKCLSVYESGNPSKEDISQFCSPGCVTTSTKFRKNMVPDGLRNNLDAHATETALKESLANITLNMKTLDETIRNNKANEVLKEKDIKVKASKPTTSSR